uniref:Uncharacterized protein n=1 Tax=Romanomermis culicivorax TaxID=13658 RepID=A0A915HTE6_ROMCU
MIAKLVYHQAGQIPCFKTLAHIIHGMQEKSFKLILSIEAVVKYGLNSIIWLSKVPRTAKFANFVILEAFYKKTDYILYSFVNDQCSDRMKVHSKKEYCITKAALAETPTAASTILK